MVITNKKVTMKKEKIKNTQYRNSFFITSNPQLRAYMIQKRK